MRYPFCLLVALLVGCSSDPQTTQQPYLDHPLAKNWGFMVGMPPQDTSVRMNFDPSGSMVAIYLIQASVAGVYCMHRRELSGIRWVPASDATSGAVTLDLSAMFETTDDQCEGELRRSTRTPMPGPRAQVESYVVSPSVVTITFRGETFTRAR